MQNSLFSYKYPNRLSEQTSTKRKPMNSFWSDASCISSFIPHLLVGLWWDEVFNEWIDPATESQIKIQTCMRRRSMNSFWSDVDASFIKIPNWVDWGNNYRASGRRHSYLFQSNVKPKEPKLSAQKHLLKLNQRCFPSNLLHWFFGTA